MALCARTTSTSSHLLRGCAQKENEQREEEDGEEPRGQELLEQVEHAVGLLLLRVQRLAELPHLRLEALQRLLLAPTALRLLVELGHGTDNGVAVAEVRHGQVLVQDGVAHLQALDLVHELLEDGVVLRRRHRRGLGQRRLLARLRGLQPRHRQLPEPPQVQVVQARYQRRHGVGARRGGRRRAARRRRLARAHRRMRLRHRLSRGILLGLFGLLLRLSLGRFLGGILVGHFGFLLRLSL
mmetsp:Transcript_12376/g.37162  ORF Transcript_12376/g.37162 Transcript_12376/m.37162 type:complete len:240 (+) Transcript_12376:244-963(+)